MAGDALERARMMTVCSCLLVRMESPAAKNLPAWPTGDRHEVPQRMFG
jgi:hypothetical protein